MASSQRNRADATAFSTAAFVVIVLVALAVLAFTYFAPVGRHDATTTSAPTNSGEATHEARPPNLPSPSPTSPQPVPGTAPAHPPSPQPATP